MSFSRLSTTALRTLRAPGVAATRRAAPRALLRPGIIRLLSDRAPPPPPSAPPPAAEVAAYEDHEWVPVVDPESGGTYYHNPMTNCVTAVGVEKPAWEPVEHEGQVYWWNVQTDETTAVGEACPALTPPPGQVAPQQPMQGGIMGQQPQGGSAMSGLGGVMAQGMAFGAGSSMAHAAIGSMMGGGSSAPPEEPAGGGGDDWGDV